MENEVKRAGELWRVERLERLTSEDLDTILVNASGKEEVIKQIEEFALPLFAFGSLHHLDPGEETIIAAEILSRNPQLLRHPILTEDIEDYRIRLTQKYWQQKRPLVGCGGLMKLKSSEK